MPRLRGQREGGKKKKVTAARKGGKENFFAVITARRRRQRRKKKEKGKKRRATLFCNRAGGGRTRLATPLQDAEREGRKVREVEHQQLDLFLAGGREKPSPPARVDPPPQKKKKRKKKKKKTPPPPPPHPNRVDLPVRQLGPEGGGKALLYALGEVNSRLSELGGRTKTASCFPSMM